MCKLNDVVTARAYVVIDGMTANEFYLLLYSVSLKSHFAFTSRIMYTTIITLLT